MGSWSTTAPTNLASSWTADKATLKQGGYRLRINGEWVYLYYYCRVVANTAWLKTGQLCIKVSNYSWQDGDAARTNPLTTTAWTEDEFGVYTYAPSESSNMGDSSETSYGHLRGTWYYTQDTTDSTNLTITAGVRDDVGVYGNGSCSVSISTGANPNPVSSGGSGGVAGSAPLPNLEPYIKINGIWQPFLWG